MEKFSFKLNQELKIDDNFIDLYWYMPVQDIPTSKIFEEVRRKGNLGVKRIIDQIRQLKLPIALIYNDIPKEGGYFPPNVIFSRRLDIGRLDWEQKGLVLRFLNRFGFVDSSLKVASIKDVERRIQQSKLSDQEKIKMLGDIADLENKDAWKIYPEEVQRKEFEKDVCLPSGTCCDFDWTGHAAYRSELRDRKPEDVNEDACKLVDSLSPNFPDKRTMKVKGRDGLIVMDYDKSKKPVDIDIITTYPKTAKEKKMDGKKIAKELVKLAKELTEMQKEVAKDLDTDFGKIAVGLVDLINKVSRLVKNNQLPDKVYSYLQDALDIFDKAMDERESIRK